MHEVHVWLLAADRPDAYEPALLRRYRALLTPDERARLERLRPHRARHLYLLTRALARCTLARYRPLAPQRWRFKAGRYGKPAVAGDPFGTPLQFNLSNTCGLVGCAVSRRGAVGLDLEPRARTAAGDALARRFFAPAEAAALAALPTAQQAQRFIDYWTLKEAYIKARGMGLALPLHRFAFQLTAPPAPAGAAPAVMLAVDAAIDDGRRWQFWLRDAGPAHRLALCAQRQPGTPPRRLQLFHTLPLAD